jgi:hypothetical protein
MGKLLRLACLLVWLIPSVSEAEIVIPEHVTIDESRSKHSSLIGFRILPPTDGYAFKAGVLGIPSEMFYNSAENLPEVKAKLTKIKKNI